MAGRGQTTFLKRQKEQQRKERQQEKFERRLQRNQLPKTSPENEEIPFGPPPPEPSDADTPVGQV